MKTKSSVLVAGLSGIVGQISSFLAPEFNVCRIEGRNGRIDSKSATLELTARPELKKIILVAPMGGNLCQETIDLIDRANRLKKAITVIPGCDEDCERLQKQATETGVHVHTGSLDSHTLRDLVRLSIGQHSSASALN